MKGNFLKPMEIALPFGQAKKFVRHLRLKKTKEWEEYCASGKRPQNIPSDPKAVYKDQFKGLRDWIGLPQERFLPFEKAREYVRENMIGRNWWEWSRTQRPSNIPARPDVIYKDQGWKSWKDWFGKSKKNFLPYIKGWVSMSC